MESASQQTGQSVRHHLRKEDRDNYKRYRYPTAITFRRRLMRAGMLRKALSTSWSKSAVRMLQGLANKLLLAEASVLAPLGL
jgi:hypothetical protein